MTLSSLEVRSIIITAHFIPVIIFNFPGCCIRSYMKVWFPGIHKKIINWTATFFWNHSKAHANHILMFCQLIYAIIKKVAFFSCLSYKVIYEYIKIASECENCKKIWNFWRNQFLAKLWKFCPKCETSSEKACVVISVTILLSKGCVQQNFVIIPSGLYAFVFLRSFLSEAKTWLYSRA